MRWLESLFPRLRPSHESELTEELALLDDEQEEEELVSRCPAGLYPQDVVIDASQTA